MPVVRSSNASSGGVGAAPRACWPLLDGDDRTTRLRRAGDGRAGRRCTSSRPRSSPAIGRRSRRRGKTRSRPVAASSTSSRRANIERRCVWSTYSTMLESSEAMFHPSFDYIIHALGPQNRRAVSAPTFTSSHPDIVQTVKPVVHATTRSGSRTRLVDCYARSAPRLQDRRHRRNGRTSGSVASLRRCGTAAHRDGTGSSRTSDAPDPERRRAAGHAHACCRCDMRLPRRQSVATRSRSSAALPRYRGGDLGPSNGSQCRSRRTRRERVFPIIARGSSTDRACGSRPMRNRGNARLVVDSLQVRRDRDSARGGRVGAELRCPAS